MSAPPRGNLRSELGGLLRALDHDPDRLVLIDPCEQGKVEQRSGDVLLAFDGAQSSRLCAHADRALAPEGKALIWLEGAPSNRELSRVRNELWPFLHVVSVCRVRGNATLREDLQGRTALSCTAPEGALLLGMRPGALMSPRSIAAKFDANAAGWNHDPRAPGYSHYRWMRRFVAELVPVPDGARILDFGCGAGWVGIEAARRGRDIELCAFDPSPQMVRNAEHNARESGVERFTGRVGFGEDPPFPAQGEQPFDLVLSSGVASFAPDIETWLDGLVRTLRPGGTLVIGDINRDSLGMRVRRALKPLLPIREMNAFTPSEMLSLLERRGLRLLRSSGYQLTWPVPKLLHLSDTRLRGWLSPPMLALNALAARVDHRLGGPLPLCFDSWVLSLRSPP